MKDSLMAFSESFVVFFEGPQRST